MPVWPMSRVFSPRESGENVNGGVGDLRLPQFEAGEVLQSAERFHSGVLDAGLVQPQGDELSLVLQLFHSAAA